MRAVVVLCVAATLGACGSDDAGDAAAPERVTVTETVTSTETVTETAPEVACSTAGLRVVLPDQDLPAAVAGVRRRVFDAAVACDYETLEQIALEKGEGFTFSYGSGDSAAEHWRRLEESRTDEPMRVLVSILAMPYTRNESGSYAWPTAYQESPTDADWQVIVDAGLYTQEQVDSMKAGGSGYLGYRTAITADGDWQFFVAGD
ncbi:MAG: hypothetical protein H0V45_07455 [Actinobacteria bacterium]|nr:hypothetical protein [Actinomycetota bacterium]